MAETTTTQISDLPEYQKKYLQEIMQRAQALGKQSYTLPSYQTAGRTPIQQQATNLATQGIGSYMPMLQAGEKATAAGIAATEGLLDPAAYQGIGDDTYRQQLADNTYRQQFQDPTAYQQYMNPYNQAVVDQSMQDINRAGQMQQNQAASRAVGAGAFGGSREGIERAEIGRNILDQQARTSAGLRQQGFAQAQQQQLQRAQLAGSDQLQRAQVGGADQFQRASALANQQLSRGQAASQGLGSLGMQQAKLGEAFQGMNMNDINLLSSVGGQEQQQRQRELDAARQTQYQNVMQPYQQLGFYSDIFQGMPTSQSTFTSQQSPDPSMLSQIGGLGMGLYSLGKTFQ